MSAPTQYPLHWPRNRGRTPHSQRRGAAFSKRVGNFSKDLSIEDSCKRLQSELDALGVDDFILSTDARPRLDGVPRSDGIEDPGAALYFKHKGKDIVFAGDVFDRLADNIAAIAKHIESLRGQDRWGVGTIQQAFAGYAALPSPNPHWTLLFELPLTAGKPEIEAAYRRLAKIHHPDTGGSDAAFAQVERAHDQALRDIGVRT